MLLKADYRISYLVRTTHLVPPPILNLSYFVLVLPRPISRTFFILMIQYDCAFEVWNLCELGIFKNTVFSSQ